mgnify:CR=1 FL=1
MLKLTPTIKFVVTGAFWGLVIVAMAGIFVRMYGRIELLASELDVVDTQITAQHKDQQQVGSLVALLQNHSADFDRLQALKISRVNPAQFFKDFEALAAQTNTSIIISLNEREMAGDTMGFQFTIEGTEGDVAAMLALIEYAPYELTIDGISVQKIFSTSVGSQTLPPGSGLDEHPSSVRLVVTMHVKASP